MTIHIQPSRTIAGRIVALPWRQLGLDDGPLRDRIVRKIHLGEPEGFVLDRRGWRYDYVAECPED